MLSIAVAAFPVCMMAAAVSDLLRMTISNRLQVALVAAFVPASLLAGLPAASFAAHAATAMAVLAVTFGCFAAGWMGGGDSKLIAATALWFGPDPLLAQYVLTATIFGGVLTLLILCARAALAPATGVAFLDRLLGKDVGVPYGIALGLAGIMAFAESAWMEPLRAAFI